jgi:hypothetical protein
VVPKGCGNATLGDPIDAGMRTILFSCCFSTLCS